MEVCEAGIVIANIIAQGCNRREAMDDGTSLFFSIRSNEWVFTIPKPLLKGGYTARHLIIIESTLASLDLELFPLDHNL